MIGECQRISPRDLMDRFTEFKKIIFETVYPAPSFSPSRSRCQLHPGILRARWNRLPVFGFLSGMNIYAFLADTVVAIHLAYVGFVVLGLLAILVGRLMNWRWIRNPWFRFTHLSMIGIVVVEALLSITCPLTTLEYYLRAEAGQSFNEGSFIGRLSHNVLFFDFPPQYFLVGYCLFGAVVLATLILVPPRMPAFLRLPSTKDQHQG